MKTNEWNQLTVYQLESRITRKAHRSGKIYKQWVWCGWYDIPNLNDANVEIKGKYLYHYLGEDNVDRYDLSCPVFKDYNRDLV